MPDHVVLLEAGSKQDFIFTSNKQAVNVGASQLIHQVGMAWVDEALDEVGVEASWRQPMSGKVVLVLPDRVTGREIVRRVTERALREAPGLEVTGVVCPVEGPLGAVVEAAHQAQRRVRANRPTRHLRWPTVPYSQPCQYSALPATATGREGDEDFPRSAPIDAAWRRGVTGRNRMEKKLGLGTAILNEKRLDCGVSNAGWIAVVHADGNGIGSLFTRLAKVEDDVAYRELYQTLSQTLDDVTKKAFAHAVDEARLRDPRTGQQRAPTGWVLPLVVGGDDVTAIMDARLAFDTVCRFLTYFERPDNGDDVRDLLGLLWAYSETSEETPSPAPTGFTGAAGVAFVKPHYPFSDAYQLAEQLCGSAKTLKNVHGTNSAVDFHVLHDSIGRPLRELRADLRTLDGDGARLRLWGGPYVVGAAPDELSERHLSRLRAAMAAQRPGGDAPATLPPGSAHRLRAALLRGGASIGRERERIEAWHDDPTELSAYLDEHLRVEVPGLAGVSESANLPFSRVVDALHLLDMETGTVDGNTTTGHEREA